MRKKSLLLFVSMMLSIGMAHAVKTWTGVLVTVPDGSTTYALTEMPKICYLADGTTYKAQLYITSKTQPVATVTIRNGQTLKAQWGTYTPSGIDGVSSDQLTTYQKEGRKFFTGGKLIIIRDGKQFDASGKEIRY